MKNTIFSIHKEYTYKNHKIVAEKRSLLYTMEYSLIIDDKKQDQIYGLYGILTMHGIIKDGDIESPIKIIMKQKVFRTKFYCIIDDKLYEMNDLKYEGV